MTAEGIFPKINGDILYASEANRMARTGFGQIGSFSTTSGTGIFDLGSIVICK